MGNRGVVRVLIAALVLVVAVACGTTMSNRSTSTLKVYDPTKWTYWGGDAGQTRYAPLDQVNQSNVSKLKIAWRWTADASGGGGSSNYKSTPILDDGILYMPWLNHGAAAIDAGTGKTIWTYEVQPLSIGGGGASLGARSLAYWRKGNQKRLFHNSLDGRLIAIDAVTGRPAAGFGNANGWIDLRQGLVDGRPAGDVRSVSPAIVVGDVVIAQVLPGGRGKEGVPGNIRGFDVLTGKQLWRFNVVPKKGEYGYETWEGGSAEWGGNAGTWTMMSADPELGYVYIAGDTPYNDFSGADRPGNNLFAESITCLDAKTGRRVWHFQTVHHGTWDYDNPAAPILHDIVKDGKRIKVVTQLTKQSFMFVFDRKTGAPIWPIEERPVPTDGVPGEKLSPTQPFPTRPAPLSHQGYNEDWLIDFTPALRAQAVEIMKGYRKGPLYTPLVNVPETKLRGTWIYPGYGGGPNWNGASIDPATDIMYIPIRHKPNAAGLQKANPGPNASQYTQSGNHTVMGPQGLPILKPPYSEVVAVDLDTGDQVWRIPLGTAPASVRNNPALRGLNLNFDAMGQFDVKPSPLLVKDMFFLGESGNLGGGSGTNSFRAYDKVTGRVLNDTPLPALVTGAPMAYMHKGREYIVVAVSQSGKPAELVALTLDGMSENGAPPPGGVPGPVAPVSTSVAAQNIPATPAELALGQQKFAAMCAICHGPNGTGDSGPRLTNRTDYDNIKLVLNRGQGEMQAMAASMTAAEIDAVAKYVVKTLGAPPPGRGGGRGGPPGGGRGGRGAGPPPEED